MANQKNIIVIGLGYIGLPTAALLASKGYKVKGVDLSNKIVNTINKGEIHIVEPDLDVYVKSAVADGNLKAFSEPQEGDIYIICVPTPFKDDSDIPLPDINYITNAVNSISKFIKDEDIIILESTSPVGTTNKVEEILETNGVDTSKIYIAYCPERVLPGKIMIELTKNARVIGGANKDSTKVVAEFYSTFVEGDILETDAKTAEMCKLIENSYRDANIAFANELSLMCNKVGVNVWELINLANHHPRVNILKPGPGVGGHCIAVDPWFLVSSDLQNTRIIQAARHINDSKPQWVINQIKQKADELKTKKIACLGLSFKPDIDDLRESPAVEIAGSLIKDGYEVACVEPNIAEHKNFKIIDLNEALSDYDVIAILVCHKEFLLNETLKKIKLKKPLDFCGTLIQNQ